MKNRKLLLVEDDENVSSFVAEYLNNNGFEVEVASSGKEMREALGKARPDLVIMDLNLPGEDGLDLARQLRTSDNLPIVMVTGRTDMVDRIIGLEMGADDYITKPFEARELLARIRSVLRRSDASVANKAGEDDKSSRDNAKFNEWLFSVAKFELYNPEGDNIHITSAEAKLLQAFVNAPQKILNRDKLIDLVYGREMSPFERSIDVLTMRLRKKLGDDSMIKTIRAQGYMFTPSVAWE